MSSPHDSFEASRSEKLQAIENLGLDPWGGRFDGHMPISDVLKLPSDKPDDQRPRVRIAGRIVSRREGGKVHFLDVKDGSGEPTLRELKSDREGTVEQVPDLTSRLQVMIGQKQVGEQGWALAQQLDLGDLIGVDGTFGKTRRGELTVFADGLTFLAKSLLPHPDKFSGMQDEEFRLRHRYLDLIYNPETLDRAKKRIQIVRTIRRFLDGLGLLSRSRRRRCTPSPAGPPPGPFRRTTTPWTSTCSSASPWSCISSGCWSAASKRSTRSAGCSATKASSPRSTIPSSP